MRGREDERESESENERESESEREGRKIEREGEREGEREEERKRGRGGEERADEERFRRREVKVTNRQKMSKLTVDMETGWLRRPLQETIGGDASVVCLIFVCGYIDYQRPFV